MREPGEASHATHLRPTPATRASGLGPRHRLPALPLTPRAAAEDNGLGAGGASFAFNFTLVVGVILAFIFGFAVRDYLHKRGLRAQAARPRESAPPRT